MNYSELRLDISVDEADDILSTRVSGIRRTRSDGTILYKSNSGITIAKLKDPPRGSSKGGSVLRYRTAMVSPTMATARTKARKIKDVLSAHRV